MKEKVITSTIESTNAKVAVFDVASNKMYNIEKTFSGKVSKDDVLKVVRKEETEEIKVVMVVSVETESKLFGMKENDFIMHGFVMDERKPKVDGEKVITRSITASVVSYKAFDVAKAEMVTRREYFSGKPTEEVALKTLRDLETDTFKVVMVSGIETITNVYAVKESTFLEYAYELPPRCVNDEKEEEV